MSRRLVKIAKELNVGTSTIVDHLTANGFEIDNKPTAKITDEMYDELLKEFQGSIEIKEKADQLVLGARQGKEAEEEESPSTITPEAPVEEKAEEAPKEEEEVIPEVEEEEEKPKVGLKVLGKIDLEKSKSKPKKAEEESKAEEEEKTEEVETVQEAEETSDDSPEDAPKETVRAEAPELRGLKILGKIDADKLKKKKKKKEEKEPVASSDTKDSNKQRRKRKRTKISASTLRGGRGQKRSSKEEPIKEVSQKEIEEKIKATMAKISGGGKSKRQKTRRASREEKREKQERLEEAVESSVIELTEFVTVSELAGLLDVPVSEVITTCMNLGVIVSINQRLDAEIIELISEEFEKEIKFISAEEQVEDIFEEDLSEYENTEPRAPIVTVMGHVDHGKTSLLDYIRSASVVSGEAGGITQHIGAYEVVVGEKDEAKKITFLDTPGHEAFTAMRARGAKITDVAVIIIAADDNVMPQTKEAISHAQAAGVPIVFAINKVDKPGADPEKIKQELASMNLLVESWGGTYQSEDISAKTGQGIDALLEKILLEAEVLELKCDPERPAYGVVIEASLDKGRGYVTKLLVENGSLEIGDVIVAGEYSGKVKAMFNERGKRVKKVGPASPVLVLGLSGAPTAGERFKEMDSEQEARQIATKRAQIGRELANRASKRISLEEIGRRLALGTFKELNLIVKGDVDGSIEALSDSLIKLSVETIQVNVIHKAVGQIIESDVLLASASDAIIIGFQVRPSLGARKLAEKEGVEIKTYSIIYEAIEEIKLAMEGMLEPTKKEEITSTIEVREVYKISKVGTIAGCYVQDGKITRNDFIRVIRDGIVIYPTKEGAHGKIASLKRFKDDVKEVKNGMECGVGVENFNDIKVGDSLESYQIVEIKQTLD